MARFSPQLLQEIKNRLTLSDIVGRRVSWHRQKSQPQRGDYWACCPFHNEKTPSFHVDDRREIYKCFGCGKSGDHFTFLTDKEGLSFPEAVERLADEAGVALPKADPREAEREKKRATLFDVVKLAQDFFRQSLQESGGAAARGYLQKRGLTPETQRRFGIGYAPKSRNALKEHLAGKGIDHHQMVEAGLLVAGPDIPVSYDKFRDRIMFPILDLRERPIAFGGRAMDPDNPAKYMNSPETPLFSKRSVLYNAAAARSAARDRGRVIAVEGYMDVIALAQAGIDEALAPLGTALTPEQLSLIWKMANEPILCFDGDGAGQRAAYRAIDVALPLLAPGKTARFAMLPNGMDPDDILRQQGREAMDEILQSARALSEILWVRETEGTDFSTPERRAALEAKIKEVLSAIADQNVRRHYEDAFRTKMRDLFYGQDNRGTIAKGGGARPNYNSRPGYGSSPRNQMQSRSSGTIAMSEQLRRNPLTARNYGSKIQRHHITPRDLLLVATLIYHPTLLDHHLEDFASLSFNNTLLQRIQNALIEGQSRDFGGDGETMRGFLVNRGLAAELEEIDRLVKKLGLWQIRAESGNSIAEIGWKQALALHHRAHTLNDELKAAQRALAEEESEANLERLLDVNAQIARMEGASTLIDGLDGNTE